MEDQFKARLHRLLGEANRQPYGIYFFEDEDGVSRAPDALHSLVCGLGALVAVQAVVSPRLTPFLFENPYKPGKLTKEGVTAVSAALMVEVAELINELDWKPWKTKAPDPAKVTEELADVLAFLGMLLLHLEASGIDLSQMAEDYYRKALKNVDRSNGASGEEGYGVAASG